MEFILKYIIELLMKLTGWSDPMAIILLVVLAVNFLMSGISSALDLIKDKTPTDVDDKISVWVHKILDWLKVIIDFLSANKAHK